MLLSKEMALALQNPSGPPKGVISTWIKGVRELEKANKSFTNQINVLTGMLKLRDVKIAELEDEIQVIHEDAAGASL